MLPFRMPRFLRRWIRRKTNPMTEEDVWWWKSRMSIAYAIFAWNAFGFVAYQIFIKKKQNWPASYGEETGDDSPALFWSRVIGVQKATVYHVEGFSFKQTGVSELDLKNTENPMTRLDCSGNPIVRKIPQEPSEVEEESHHEEL